jgi:hypothetical protein
VVLGIAVVGLTILPQHFPHRASSSDGLPSKFEDANALCEKALRIIRSDDYSRFLQAYTNLNRAIELDPRTRLFSFITPAHWELWRE